MKIKRIEHVAVAVKNMEATMAVLERVFDMKLEYKQESENYKIAMYPIGETYVELVEGKHAGTISEEWIRKQGEGLFHLCFEVDDILAAMAELRAKGVKLLNEEPRIGHGGCKIAFIDPQSTGHLFVELAEMPKDGAHGH